MLSAFLLLLNVSPENLIFTDVQWFNFPPGCSDMCTSEPPLLHLCYITAHTDLEGATAGINFFMSMHREKQLCEHTIYAAFSSERRRSSWQLDAGVTHTSYHI